MKYDACILVDADDGKPWCSTKTDNRGQHIGGQGQWGHCAGSCPVAGKKDDFIHVNVEGSSSISNTKLSQIPWCDIILKQDKYFWLRLDQCYGRAEKGLRKS